MRILCNIFLVCIFVFLIMDNNPSSECFQWDSSKKVMTQKSTQSGEIKEAPYQYKTGEILVRFCNSTQSSTRTAIHEQLGTNVVKEFNHIEGLQLVSLSEGMTVQDAARRYLEHSEVLYAEPNYQVKLNAIPNDPEFSSQWGLYNTGQTGGTPGADIHAPEAWDLTTGSKDIVIAVIDTGVDYTHPDLVSNMFRNTPDCNNDGIDDDGNGYIDDCYGINTLEWNSDPMDEFLHGTNIAGIIGASGDNNIDIAGVNWITSVLACRFYSEIDGSGTIAGAIACLDYVAEMKDRGVNIVASNNSWNGNAYSQALYDAIEAQMERGILFITSAIDLVTDNDKSLQYPCAYDLPNNICVASTEDNDNKVQFSNYGHTTVHLGAPGENILTTAPAAAGYGEYVPRTGSSMAAAFVTGVVGLTYAYYPDADWREIKNRILAGGDIFNSTHKTITDRRLNAYGALTCSDSIVIGRMKPHGATLTVGIVPVELSALHINCANPNGNIIVTVSPANETVTLLDNGLDSDLIADDGIYSGTWIPPTSGTYVLKFPDEDNVTVNVDADLQAGFPAKAFSFSGLGSSPLVANIDSSSEFKIFVPMDTYGTVNAWKDNGTPLPGWPIQPGLPTIIAAGELSLDSPGDEIIMCLTQGYLLAVDGSGYLLPGWPIEIPLSLAVPPLIADIVGDERDEIIIGQRPNMYSADGVRLNWLKDDPFQISDMLGSIDLDLDGDLEIVTYGKIDPFSEENSDLIAWHHTGDLVAGFPVPSSFRYFALGDVDGDGLPEIVGTSRQGTLDDYSLIVWIYGNTGILKNTFIIPKTSAFYPSPPSLADLNDDGKLEIIVQTDEALHVLRSDGTYYPGWPVVWGDSYQLSFSAPVIGDVDGDQIPDIITTSLNESTSSYVVHVFDHNGILHPHFPKNLRDSVNALPPAIADIDADGHNEIIIVGSDGGEYRGSVDTVWVYDLGGPNHGPVLWGQAQGNAQNTRTPTIIYPTPRVYHSLSLTLSGEGTVNFRPSGKECSDHCMEYLNDGTSATLTAEADSSYVFDGWDGDCADQQGNSCTLFMDSDKNVTALFRQPSFDFSSPPSPSSRTVSAGQSAQYQIEVTGQSGFTGIVSFSCSSDMPQGTNYSFSPVQLNPGSGTASTTLAITSTSRTLAGLLQSPSVLYAFLLMPPMLFLTGIRLRFSKMKRLASFAILIILSALLIACGSGTGESQSQPLPNPNGTPSGTYTIVVEATSGVIGRTQNVTLRVN